MAYPKELRNKLGISVEAFATLINCGFGQLSMAESGKRSLPTISLQILNLIEQKLAQNQLPAVTASLQDEKTIAFLQKRTDNCQSLIKILRYKLSVLEEKYSQASSLQRLTTEFETDDSLPDVGNTHLQMQVLKRQSKAKLQKRKQEWVELQLTLAATEAELQKALELD